MALHKEVRGVIMGDTTTVPEVEARRGEQVPIPVPHEVAFLDSLLQWIVTSAENALQREALMHLIAAVVNRHAESTYFALNVRG